MQPDLFSAYEARAEAIEQVDANADKAWKAAAEAAVIHIARMRPTFTADDVWDHLNAHSDEHTHEPRALGAIMNRLMAANTIRKTGEYRPSRRRRAAPIPVWTAR